jgi:hypothetical protein
VKGLVCIALLGLGATAHAAKHPRFEPTDLELEEPGTAEIDLQLGVVRGQDLWRVVMPDFELDLGLLSKVELDLDGAYAIEDGSHQLPDNLWPSVKVGLADWIGVQAGPKIPIAPDSHGVGVEGLALVSHTAGRVHAVLDVGGLVDPRTGTSPRPVGLEAGVDLEIELVPDTWSALFELGGVHYRSADADQLAVTGGVQYSPSSWLDLSLVALVGLASGSDRFGLMFGVSPKFGLW